MNQEIEEADLLNQARSLADRLSEFAFAVEMRKVLDDGYIDSGARLKLLGEMKSLIGDGRAMCDALFIRSIRAGTEDQELLLTLAAQLCMLFRLSGPEAKIRPHAASLLL